ncbi:MAG: discoidin domain-containing protein, partial [Oscillospiraceae bacterium]
EVGADWCDGWLVDYDWIKGYRPEIKTREDKLNYFKTSLQFLIDEVYNTPSGAMIDNHPVVFLFGGGPTPAEMKDIINSKYTYPELMKTPYFIRRTGLTGKYQNGNVSFSDPSATTKDWRNAGVDVHQWIVPRIRPMDEKYPYFDKYASFDDVKNYAQDYKKLWDKGEKVNVNTAVVTPGFDNRGCAAWGDGTYHGFDREGGEVYKWQWDFYNKNKEQIDVMFIASWSDFTEGHEIEPTVVNGYRELETTLEYSTQFKDAEYDENAKEGMKVPQKLFETKKYTRKIGEIGFDVKDGLGMLDEAALGVSKGAYKFAESMISKTETINKEYEKNIEMQTITLSSENGNMKVVSYPKAEHQGSGIDGVEVAQGKPVSTNDDLSEGRAKNAVDGIIANSSRWITSQSKESYWLEIDLQNEYTLVGAELYTGKDEKTYGLKNVRLQYYKDSEWVDIPGAAVKDNPESNTDLFWKFDKSVVASKVRVVCDEGAVGVRVREVKIYGDPDLTEEKPNKPPVVKGKNIAKGKNVKTNNELSEGPIGNINDGIIADSSRWMTAQTLDSYWAEIDFGSEQKIVACDAYTGKDDGSWALETARLEYLVGENWATIPGAMVTGNSKTNTNLSWTFTEPVTTSKVRFVSDDGARGVRVREVMVYAEGVAESGNAENDTAFLESRGKEIAQGKTVKASTALKNNGAEKAVDGLVSDLSSWLTATNEDKYWLEVDLGGEYEIMGTDILSGKGDGTWAMQNVKLQAWQGDKWVDISGGGVKNNPKSKTDIKLNFNDTVKTDKVRLVCDDKDRGVRLRELKIYEAKAEASTSTTKVHNLGQGAYITVDEDTAKILRDNYFDAMLNLEYLGDTNQTFTITADCDRPLPEKIGTTQGNFATVAEIREDITHGWEKCRVKMFKDNLDLNHGLEKDSDFIIKGTGNVRNIEMTFKVYKKVRSDDTTHEK